VMDKIEEFGKKLRDSHPTIMAFADVLTLPLTSLGAIVSAIVHGEPSRIPEYLKANFDRCKPAIDEFVASVERGLIRLGEAILSGMDRVKRTFEEAWQAINEGAKIAWGIMTTTLIEKWNAIKSIAIEKWNAIKDAIWTPIQSAYDKIRYYIDMIISKIESIPSIGNAASYVSSYIPSFQHGGYVPSTGLAMLHAGEYVMPTGNTRTVTNSPTIVLSPTIYVTGEMRTDTDLRKLAGDLSVYFKDEIKRMVRG
jgi:hypothetical protein